MSKSVFPTYVGVNRQLSDKAQNTLTQAVLIPLLQAAITGGGCEAEIFFQAQESDVGRFPGET